MPTVYIYKVHNDVDDYVFVGKTIVKDLRKTLANFKSCANNPVKCKTKLHQHIKELGKEHFFIELLEKVDSNEQEEKFSYWKSFLEKNKVVSPKSFVVYTCKSCGVKHINFDLYQKHLAEHRKEYIKKTFLNNE